MRSGTVGIREAKARLSRLVREVSDGAEWVITDRGRPVAKLVPMSADDCSPGEAIGQLERWGWIDAGRGGMRSLPPPIRVPGDVAQRALQRDRDG